MRVLDTIHPILELAKALMKDLRRQSGALERFELGDV